MTAFAVSPVVTFGGRVLVNLDGIMGTGQEVGPVRFWTFTAPEGTDAGGLREMVTRGRDNARKEIASVVLGAAEIVARRATTGQLRLGASRISSVFGLKESPQKAKVFPLRSLLKWVLILLNNTSFCLCKRQ